MGVFEVTVQIGNLTGEWSEPISALVDTGSSHTMVAAPLLDRLGIGHVESIPFELADNRVTDLDVGEGRIRIDGRERNTLLVFGQPDASALLGASTLEVFNLGVDPVGQRLVPVRGLLKSTTNIPP